MLKANEKGARYAKRLFGKDKDVKPREQKAAKPDQELKKNNAGSNGRMIRKRRQPLSNSKSKDDQSKEATSVSCTFSQQMSNRMILQDPRIRSALYVAHHSA